MDTKKTAMLVAAVVIMIIAIWTFARRMQPEPTLADPMAHWVCDNCGHETKAPFENKSIDCPKCDKGQMVLRVYWLCKRCDQPFEAYQENYAPFAPRGEPKRKEADEQGPMAVGVPKEDAVLVRKPGGKWAWAESEAGRQIRALACPKCGVGKREQFKKALDPSSR